MPILNVDANNWEQIYDVILSAEVLAGMPNYHHPIPAHSIPVVIDRHTLIVGALSGSAKPTWNLGYYLSMVTHVQGIGRPELASKFIRLGLNLVRLPPVTPEYTLKARIPKWHQEMQIVIWKYVGVEEEEPYVTF